MELLDRYLTAVKRHLPRGQRDDIAAELSDNLRSAMEQRAVELGRPLDDVEATALLERHGDPFAVASRYRKDQRSLVLGRQLIGPEWFSLYWNVLWLTLGVTVAAAFLVAHALGRPLTLPGFLVPLFLELVIVTLVFALIDVGNRRERGPQGLLERYVQAVRDGLPRDQQADIVAELRENLLAQVEDREAGFGRPLAEVELEALLTAHGHPLVVAGRYRQDGPCLSFGRQLIGPVLFSFYVKVLGLNMALSLVACLIAIVVFARQGSLLHWAPTLLVPVILQLAIITTLFAVIERWIAKNPGSWNQHSPGWAKAERPPRVSRVASILQLAILAVFFSGLRSATTAISAASGHIASAGVTVIAPWHLYSLSVSALIVMEMLQPLVNLVRPEWTAFRQWARAIGTTLWLGILCLILATGPWLALTGPFTALAEKRWPMESFNTYVFYNLLCVAVFFTGLLVVEVRLLMRDRRRA